MPGAIHELIQYCGALLMMFQGQVEKASEFCEIVGQKSLFELVLIECY